MEERGIENATLDQRHRDEEKSLKGKQCEFEIERSRL